MAGFDATLGGSGATSYISIETADDLLLNTFNGTWQGNTAAESQYLMAATFWLEQVLMRAQGAARATTPTCPRLWLAALWGRCDGIGATCAFIPRDVQWATAISAVELTANPNLIGGDWWPWQ